MRKIFLILIAAFSFSYANVSGNIINSISTPYSNLISNIYALNGNKYLWINNPTRLQKAVNALSNGYFNYKNKPLNRAKITQLLYALDAGSLDEYNKAKLDILVTDAYIKLLKFIRVGDVNWSLVKQKMNSLRDSHDIRATWEMGLKGMPSAKTILSYIQSGRINSLLAGSIGLKDRYKSFIDILQYYRKIPEFKKVPFGKIIKYGSRDKRIYQIKRRLKILGDFPRNASITRKFDKNLAYAITKFRKRFNLRAGNYIDNKLIGYINLPKSYYISKIIVNLDKTKLYQSRFENLYVEVNVPEFRMRLYKNGTEHFSSDAIVGRLDRPTPIFNDKLEYVVVNPTWTIPENLVKRDLIPALKNDPTVLETAHIKAYQGGKEVTPNLEKLFTYEHSKRSLPYQFVQKPGEDNALGQVKFMFPNKYAVYLHDTPHKGLFNHRYRYNSSGCMRINDPKGFYNTLSPYLKVNRDIDSAIASNKTIRVNLKRKIPVHIVYFTLEFENGSPKFLYDAYMYDKIIEESTAGNVKNYFEVPAVRLQEVRR
jgi:murein L,D-transpeptidase YcbB/YkuD